MADVVERVRVVLEAEGLIELRDGSRISAEEVRKLGDQLSRTSKDVEGLSEKARNAGQHVGGLARDIAQGDWRGAAVNVGRLAMGMGGLASAGTLAGMGLGAAAVAAVGLAVAHKQAGDEAHRQADALLLTGNYAGLVAGQLNQMAREAAAGINGNVSSARSIMEALTASGRVTQENLVEMTRSIELVARYSGRTKDEVTKDFASMSKGVADWAAKHNESWHFITYEQYKYIESLEKTGKVTEAMQATSKALNKHLGNDLAQNLGTLQKAWKGVGDWASLAWDKMLGVGREKTATDKVAEIAAQIEALDKRKTTGRLTGDRRDELRERLVSELALAQEIAREEREAAEFKSRKAQENERRIAEDRAKKTGAGAPDRTYETLNAQIERRLVLAQAEEQAGERLKASDQFRLEMLRQIDAAEGKLGAQRAQKLRALVEETAAILQNNEARAEALKRQQEMEAARLREYQAQEQEIRAIEKGNEALELQIASVGKTKSQIEELKAQRIEHVIALREEQYATLALFGASADRLEQIQREIEALRQKRDLTRTLSEKEAADELRRKQEADGKRYSDELRHDVTNALMRAFEASKNPATALADTLSNTIKTRVMRALAEAIANPLLKPLEQSLGGLSGALGGLFGGGISTPTTEAPGLADMLSVFYHSGGIVGAEPTFSRAVSPMVFAGAPRFHTGGIAGDEVPIIAKRGEGVFTPGQMRALGGASGGAPIMLNLKVVNNGQATQVSTQTRQTSGGFDLDVILDAVDDGMADRVSAGQGQFVRAFEGRYLMKPGVN